MTEHAWSRRSILAAAGASCWTPLASLPLAAPAWAQAPAWTPMSLAVEGSIIVRAVIGGSPCFGLLDNGVPWSMIDIAHAKTLGWASTRNLTPLGAPTRTEKAIAFELGGRRETIRARLIDLSLFGPIEGEPLRAIIGPEFVSAGKLALDFDAGMFATLDRREPSSARDGAATFKVKRRDQMLTGLPLQLEGSSPVEARIDLASGAALTIMQGPLSDSWFEAAGSPARGWSSSLSFHQSINGGAEAKNILTSLSSVQLGAFVLRDVPVEVIALPPGAPPATSSDDPRVTIGPEFLQRFFAVLDTPAGEVTLAPARRFGAEFRRNLTGLGLKPEGDRLRIMHVGDNSPAAEAGFKVGEFVTALNGAAPRRETLRAAAPGQVFVVTTEAGEDKRVEERSIEARRFY